MRCSQVWEGKGVVKSARKLIGATNPLEAEPGTIRGDLAVQTGRNVVHGSDSPQNGERESGAPVLGARGMPRCSKCGVRSEHMLSACSCSLLLGWHLSHTCRGGKEQWCMPLHAYSALQALLL